MIGKKILGTTAMFLPFFRPVAPVRPPVKKTPVKPKIPAVKKWKNTIRDHNISGTSVKFIDDYTLAIDITDMRAIPSFSLAESSRGFKTTKLFMPAVHIKFAYETLIYTKYFSYHSDTKTLRIKEFKDNMAKGGMLRHMVAKRQLVWGSGLYIPVRYEITQKKPRSDA